MPAPHKLALKQLAREKMRLLVATGGVAFAVVLMLMQLGFQRALFQSSVKLHSLLSADLYMISPLMQAISKANPFSKRRLVQAAGTPGVAKTASLYFGYPALRNPENGKSKFILALAFDPDERVLEMPEIIAAQEQLKMPGAVLWDTGSRPEYGPITEIFQSGKPVDTELNARAVHVVGLFLFGVSFTADGTLVMSDRTFFQIAPDREGEIDIGLVSVSPGADLETVRQAIVARVPQDVIVLTREEYMAREKQFWREATAIGFIFNFGVVIGFLVGSVIVYQILYSDVADHLAEYATLKAMGYGNGYLNVVVLSQSVILSALGFVPGALVSQQLYRIAAKAANLPMRLDTEMALTVFALTLVMCTISGSIALRKVSSADPAAVF